MVLDRVPWTQFLEEVEAAKADLGGPELLWYRGHANGGWGLVPSLFRIADGLQKEQFLFHEYKRSASRFHERRSNDWETLVDMQHYGIPTRLLDWTEVLGVAVAFAVLRQYGRQTDAAIFLLDPLALNRCMRIEGVKHLPDDKDFDYQSVYWNHRPFAAQSPVCVDVPFQNPRILAQRGVFTIHGIDQQSINDVYPDAVRKVVLPREAYPAAREFLGHANLNEYSIYPDIFGMTQHIISRAFGEGWLR